MCFRILIATNVLKRIYDRSKKKRTSTKVPIVSRWIRCHAKKTNDSNDACLDIREHLLRTQSTGYHLRLLPTLVQFTNSVSSTDFYQDSSNRSPPRPELSVRLLSNHVALTFNRERLHFSEGEATARSCCSGSIRIETDMNGCLFGNLDEQSGQVAVGLFRRPTRSGVHHSDLSCCSLSFVGCLPACLPACLRRLTD